MDYARIAKLNEVDFDTMLTAAGGRRFSVDHSREKVLNADYVLANALVELKLVNEEGLEKQERQRKVADVFRAKAAGRPVVVIRPDLLDEMERREYYSVMMGPIKTHIEKANKQLKRSAEALGTDPTRILLLVNNGYAALSHEEFMDIATRRACNATHNIDAVVVAGLYYYSDTFDSYFFPRIDLFPLHVDRPFESYEWLAREWTTFAENFITRFMIDGETRSDDRLPVQELVYRFDGVTYVKPAPPMGKPSEFFVNGRPRRNSSGIASCPPLARTFPDLDQRTWEQFKAIFPDEDFFKSSFAEWINFRRLEERRRSAALRPFVPVSVGVTRWSEWCTEGGYAMTAQSVAEYANAMFGKSVKRLIAEAMERSASQILVPRHILVRTEVIGQDMANDLSSIYLVSTDVAGETLQPLLENQRIFFEHALALGSALALKHSVETVRYEKDLTDAWV